MEIFGLDVLKSAIIIAVVLLYWKFIYYPYHKRDYTPISIFIIGATLFFIGIYAFFFEKSVILSDVLILYSIFFLFLAVSFTEVLIGIHKHGLRKDVDITLTWAKRVFPFVPFWGWMIIAFPALFFIPVATLKILGPEHVVFWGMVFLAWVASGLKLYRKEIAK